MPPHSKSNFVGMPEKMAKASPASLQRGEAEALQTPLYASEIKRPGWKSFKKNTSKVTPKETSPKQPAAGELKWKISTSVTSTPTKPVSNDHPVKSSLKNPGDESHKSLPPSPALSHRSEFTQLSLRSEFTDNSGFDSSLFQLQDDGESTPKQSEIVEVEEELEDEQSHDQTCPAGQPISTVQESLNRPIVDREAQQPFARHREIPTAFVEAFSRAEEEVADSTHMGPYLLKLAKSYASGENPVKALEYCIRAVKFYERHSTRENALDLVISLHILAALHCHLGQYEDAVALLERSLTIPDVANGGDEHALAAFSGHMQLADTLGVVGQLGPSLRSYHKALEIQKAVLGDYDPRVAETCNYIAETHVQVLEFAEAEELCAHSLVIHTEHIEPGSLEEAADRRLLAIIYSAQGYHEKALDSLVYANELFVNLEQEIDVATGNQAIGMELLALGRDAEAILCFLKCVEDYKTLRGEHHALVASVYTNLAELYLRTNKPQEARSNCQSALHIYAKQGVGHIPGDVAYGLMDIASTLEQLNEAETALLLLQRAYDIQDRMPGQQATVAGIEAQIGILQFMTNQFKPAMQSFQNAVVKMKSGTLRDSPLVGMVLNQMGLTSIELGELQQAAGFFEEAKGIMDGTAGPHHLDTLDVCNNLACTYNALGRVEEAREILEEVVQAKEDVLGAVHPDVEEDRARLQELVSQVGQTTTYKRSRKLAEMLTSARRAFHTSK